MSETDSVVDQICIMGLELLRTMSLVRHVWERGSIWSSSCLSAISVDLCWVMDPYVSLWRGRSPVRVEL